MTFWEFIPKFDTIWKPFWHNIGIRNPLKSLNIAIPRGIKKLPVFGMVFIDFWGSNWEPQTWKTHLKKRPKTGSKKNQFQDPLNHSAGRKLGSGKGVGGRVNPSPKEGRKGIGTVQHLKPPSHRGWWDYSLHLTLTFIIAIRFGSLILIINLWFLSS